MLDRIVGYDVSALVWSKLAFGLSAGRVQSVALRLIVDREREIEAFVPEEYWNVGVRSACGQKRPQLRRPLVSADGEKFEVKNGDRPRARPHRSRERYATRSRRSRAASRSAKRPRRTRRRSSSKTRRATCSFATKRTMQIAQGLYEGVDLGKDGGTGRSHHVHAYRLDARQRRRDQRRCARTSREHVRRGPPPREAQRLQVEEERAGRPRGDPPDLARAPRPSRCKKHLKDEQYKLYKLIWDRFVASQMTPAVYDQTAVDIEATVDAPKARPHRTYGLRASGRVLKFGGWLEVYGKGSSAAAERARGRGRERRRPAPTARGANGAQVDGQAAGIAKRRSRSKRPDASSRAHARARCSTLVAPPGVIAEQKFTQPPAALQRRLAGARAREARHRPARARTPRSSARCRRATTSRSSRRAGFKPTLLGKFVVDGLVVELARLHGSELHRQDGGGARRGRGAASSERVALLKRFYKRFREQLDKSKKQKRWKPEPTETDIVCDECGSKMLKRWSKNGWFLGCSGYPKCKSTQDLGPDGDGTTPAPVRDDRLSTATSAASRW